MKPRNLFTTALLFSLSFSVFGFQANYTFSEMQQRYPSQMNDIIFAIQDERWGADPNTSLINSKVIEAEKKTGSYQVLLSHFKKTGEISYSRYAMFFMESVNRLGTVYHRAGYYDNAEAYVRQCIRLARDTWLEPDYLESLSRVRGNKASDLKIYDELLAHPELLTAPDSNILAYRISRFAYHAENHQEAGNIQLAKQFYHDFFEQVYSAGVTKHLVRIANEHWHKYMAMLDYHERANLLEIESWRSALINAEEPEFNTFTTSPGDFEDFMESFSDIFRRNFEEESLRERISFTFPPQQGD
jgi:tetratricopeptide (TPR) repeat protein